MHPAGPQDVTDTHHTPEGQPGNLTARIACSCLIQCACMSPTFVSARWIEKFTDLYVVVAGSRYPFALWSRSGAQVERVAAHGLMSVCDKRLGPIRCSWHHYCLDIRHAALQDDAHWLRVLHWWHMGAAKATCAFQHSSSDAVCSDACV